LSPNFKKNPIWRQTIQRLEVASAPGCLLKHCDEVVPLACELTSQDPQQKHPGVN
jgi:hypothetical protein